MATRFPTAVGSESAAINAVEDQVNSDVVGVLTTDATGAATTNLTAAQTINGVYRLTTASGGVALTFPSAASVVAAIPQCQVGSRFDLAVINAGSGQTITLTAGTGNTLTGTAAVATNTSQIVKGIVTNATVGAEAVTYLPVLKTAS